MLLKNHRRYAKEALKGLRFGAGVRDQVITGASANDLCEFTNESQPFLMEKAGIRRVFGPKERLLGHIALWQSHFGYLASMHVMSKTPGEPAATTFDEVRAWFEFLNGMALGRIRINPNAEIGSDGTPIDALFVAGKLHIEYHQLFDSEDDAEIRSRAVGMMLHLVEDSFTPCHCRREDNGEISEFYCYKLQDSGKHREADDVLPRDLATLVAECRECANSVLLRKRPYDCGRILKLRANPDPSGGGAYR